MEKIMLSIKMTMSRYSDLIYLKSSMNIKSNNIIYRKFQFVTYNAIFSERALSIIDTCTDDCEHFHGRAFSDEVCKGNVYDCKNIANLGDSAYWISSVKFFN